MQTRSYWNQYNMTFRDETYGPSQGGSIWQLCPIAAQLDPSVAHLFYDDFYIQPGTKASASGNYVIVEDDGASGTDAVQDSVGGIYLHYADGDDNDEAYLISAHETWKFAAGKSLWFEAKCGVTEGATNEAQFIVGLMDNAGADSVLDTEAGPAAEYDGAVFFKVGGALSYYAESSNATTQTTSAALGSIVSGTANKFGFFVKTESTTDTTAKIQFYVDGVAVGSEHTLTLSGLAEMHFIIGVKSGENAAEDAFFIDYVKIVQIR
jgi:hypothetical protein